MKLKPNFKKIFTLLTLVFSFSLLAASCKKLGGVKIEPFSVQGELKPGGCCNGTDTGNDSTFKMLGNSVSLKVNADGSFTGNYVWDIDIYMKTITGDTMRNTLEDKANFTGTVNSKGEFDGTFEGSRKDTIYGDLAGSETYPTSGEIHGRIKGNQVTAYLTVPVVLPNTPQSVVDLYQPTGEYEKVLKTSYLYFELNK